MSVANEVREEILRLDEVELTELLLLVRAFVAEKATTRRPRLLSRLSAIRIDAPPDLSSRLDRNEMDDHGG